MRVGVGAADDINDAADDIRLRESLEEALILTELAQSCAGVKGHMKIVILVRKFIDERADNHLSLLFKNLLHELLVSCELGLWLRAVIVAIVAGLPLVLHLGLDLLLNQLDHQRCQRMLVKVSQQAVEDLALLVKEQVLKRCHLLLV